MKVEFENKAKYLHVCFNVETPAYWHPERRYDYSLGWDDDRDRAEFRADFSRAFSARGWYIDGADVHKGKSSLFVHPQSLTGTISEDLKSEVVAIVEMCKTFHLRKYPDGRYFIVELGTKYDISADEMLRQMDTCREEIEETLLEAFKTKRRNLWWMGEREKLHGIADELMRHVLDDDVNQMVFRRIEEIFNSLVSAGKILCRERSDGYVFYRTLSKYDRRAA